MFLGHPKIHPGFNAQSLEEENTHKVCGAAGGGLETT